MKSHIAVSVLISLALWCVAASGLWSLAGDIVISGPSGTIIRHQTPAEIVTSEAAAAQEIADREQATVIPIQFSAPIEAPAIVFRSITNGIGVAQVARDDGTVVTVTWHASPVPSKAVLDQRIRDAFAAHDASKTVLSNKAASVRGNSGNSVAALRQQVLDLQAQIDAIQERLR